VALGGGGRVYKAGLMQDKKPANLFSAGFLSSWMFFELSLDVFRFLIVDF